MAGFAWSPCSLGVAAGEEKVPLMMRSSRLFLQPGTEGAQGRGADRVGPVLTAAVDWASTADAASASLRMHAPQSQERRPAEM